MQDEKVKQGQEQETIQEQELGAGPDPDEWTGQWADNQAGPVCNGELNYFREPLVLDVHQVSDVRLVWVMLSQC